MHQLKFTATATTTTKRDMTAKKRHRKVTKIFLKKKRSINMIEMDITISYAEDEKQKLIIEKYENCIEKICITFVYIINMVLSLIENM